MNQTNKNEFDTITLKVSTVKKALKFCANSNIFNNEELEQLKMCGVLE